MKEHMTNWLLTYAVHSTAFIALTWLWLRSRVHSPRVRDMAWKFAMGAGLLTATIQLLWGASPVAIYAVSELQGGITPLVSSTTPVPRDVTVAIGSLASEGGWTWGWHDVVLVLWLTGALLSLALVGLRHARVMRLIGQRRSASPRLIRAVDNLAPEAGIVVTTSSALPVPIAFGMLRKEICVPKRAEHELSELQLQCMLGHEVAHHRRRDPLWRVLAAGLQSLMYFQPLNRLAIRRQREVSEILCDEWAAAQTRRPTEMASCLVAIAQWIAGPSSPLVAAMAGQRSQLRERVESLVARKTSPVKVPRRVAVAAALAVALVVAFAPGATRAEDPSGANASPVPSAKTPKTLSKKERAELRRELKNARKELEAIDLAQIRKEVEMARREVQSIDFGELRKELAEARKELAVAKVELRKELAEARKELDEELGPEAGKLIELGLKAAEAGVIAAEVAIPSEKEIEAIALSAMKAVDSIPSEEALDRIIRDAMKSIDEELAKTEKEVGGSKKKRGSAKGASKTPRSGAKKPADPVR